MNELELRAMIRDAIRGALADIDLGANRPRAERVRLASDADLQQFARRLAQRCADPGERDAIARGEVVFRLDVQAAPRTAAAPTPTAGGASARQPAPRPSEPVTVLAGAVTERHVRAAADNGGRLRLGRRARLTPLARETVRELGVRIEKETAR